MNNRYLIAVVPQIETKLSKKADNAALLAQ